MVPKIATERRKKSGNLMIYLENKLLRRKNIDCGAAMLDSAGCAS